MKTLIAALAATAAFAAAAQPMPMKPDFERGLGVSAETAAKVEQVFAKEREQHLALHEKSKAELAKFLTPEQLAKFESAGPRRGEGRGPGAGYGPHGMGPGHGMGGGQGMGPGRGMGPGAGMGQGMGYGMGMGPGAGKGWARGDCPAANAKTEKPSA